MPIITGILLGLGTLIFIGPVFFYLLKASLEQSIKAGLAVAFGIIFGDIICVILALKGFGETLEHPLYKKLLALIGGLMLIIMGAKYVLQKTKNRITKNNKKEESIFTYGLNGFLINFINPFVFAVWFGFLAINQSKYTSQNDIITSLVATLCTILITDSLKVIFAHKLKPFINAKRLTTIYKVFGVLMFLFGIRLMWSFFSI